MYYPGSLLTASLAKVLRHAAAASEYPVAEFGNQERKVDTRLPGKGNSNSHGAKLVHHIISMIKWIWTSRLSIKKSFRDSGFGVLGVGLGEVTEAHLPAVGEPRAPAQLSRSRASRSRCCTLPLASRCCLPQWCFPVRRELTRPSCSGCCCLRWGWRFRSQSSGFSVQSVHGSGVQASPPACSVPTSLVLFAELAPLMLDSSRTARVQGLGLRV